MPKMRIYPHRVADAGNVAFGDWWIERDGARRPLPDRLDGWDYASEEFIGTLIQIEVRSLLKTTGHSELSDIEALVLADCPSAQRRIVARHRLVGRDFSEAVALGLRLPAGQLAGSIRLSVHLVVAKDLEGMPPRVASARGARLISSTPRLVILEGDASRFPTEPVAFSELRLPNAPWTLHCTFEDLNSSFMGGVRLLVNTEHPVGRMLLDSSSADRVSGLAMADVIRLLVASLADRMGEDEPGGFTDGGVGQVVDFMCDFFLGSNLATAVQMYRQEPLHFDRVVHDRIKPLAKVFA